jgi:hypothetical protein
MFSGSASRHRPADFPKNPLKPAPAPRRYIHYQSTGGRNTSGVLLQDKGRGKTTDRLAATFLCALIAVPICGPRLCRGVNHR